MEKTIEERIAESLHHIGRRLDVMQTTLNFMALGPKAVVGFVHDDQDVLMYVPDALTDNIQRFIMERRCFWEESLLVKARSHLVGCRTAIDIGANIGNHTVYFSMVAGMEKVIAVEPQVHVHRILEHNIALNALDGVTTVNAVVGAACGRAEIGLHRHRSFHGTTYRASETGESTMVTVAELAEEPVDFIKIDVEGMQLDVLRGAEGVLRRDRPKLWIELRRNHGEFEPANEYLTSLDLGYRPTPLGGDDVLFTVS